MPIYDNSTSLDLTDARIEKKKKEYQLKDLYQNFEQTLKATKQDIEFDENLMSNQQERINIYSERENEARKRLSQAKIDYSDYIRYRDALLNEKIKAIDTTTSLFFKKLDLYSISDTIPKICEDK
jgi:outer membrane protein TolC